VEEAEGKKKKKKTPEKTKFSPKVLRSRARQSDVTDLKPLPLPKTKKSVGPSTIKVKFEGIRIRRHLSLAE
jgi:hypothetical protein